MDHKQLGKWLLYVVFGMTLFLPFTAHSNSTIPFSAGWNFISFPQLPSNSAQIETVLRDISPNVRIIWGYDNKNKVWLKYKQNIQNSSLNVFDVDNGYWLYMDKPATLLIQGNDVSANKILLHEGWNLIGYHEEDGADTGQKLSNPTIKDSWEVIWGWDNGVWKARHADPSMNITAEPLSTLHGGKAYWIKIKYGAGDVHYNPYPPIITSNPASISFGETVISSLSSRQITLSNTGKNAFTVNLISISGTYMSDFSQTNNCSTILSNGSCNVSVTFHPTSAGTKKATLVISSDDPATPSITLPLDGTGIIQQYALTISKTGTGNGTVTSSPSGITCGADCTQNYDDGTVVVLSAAPDTNSSFTGWSGACTGTDTCHVTMSAIKNVTAAFTHNNPDIAVSPISYDFGNVKVSATSPSATFTITNSGKANLIVSSVTISGTNAGEFSQTNNCSTVSVGSQCTINANFKPTLEGAKSATVSISSNDPDTGTINISLTGTGISATPPTVLSNNPVNGATGVLLTASITATFSKAMDSSTINSSTFTVKAGGTNVNGTVNYNSATKIVTFTPSSTLSKGITYTVTVSDGCKDLVGNAMASTYTWTFTTVESASGIWGGTFTSNVEGKTYNILGVIAENGEARFLSDEGAQFSGNVSVSGSTLTSTVTAFAPPGYVFVNGSTYGTVRFTGTVKTKNSLTGTYSGVGDTGTFTLTYDVTYERGSSLSSVSGNWSNSDPSGYSQNVTVNANGTFTGNNSSGCTFSGNVTIINPSYDAYRLDNVRIGSCGAFNGTYTGLGVLWDNSTTNDTFTFGMSNSYASMVLTFKR